MLRPLKVAILADAVVHQVEGDGAGRGDGQGATWLPHLVKALMLDPSLEIYWISLRRDLASRQEIHIDRHTFIELPQPAAKFDILTRYTFARNILLNEVHNIAPDVIHCWGTERAYPSILKFTQLPKLLSFNGVLSKLKQLEALPHGWRWKLQCQLEKSWLQSANMISGESKWACDAIKEINHAAVTRQVCYGVHPSFYDVLWDPDASERVAVFAGTVCKGKGIHILVDAFEKLSKRGWVCKVAGDGPLQKTLETRNIPGIRWLGLLGWKELQKHLQNAHCLVHPTLADSQPNVVKEARVIGLPIISTQNGGQAEYLLDGENAVIVPQTDAAYLVAALEKVLGMDNESIRRMGKTGWMEDRERFQTKRTATAFSDLYHELATNNDKKTFNSPYSSI